MLCLEYSILDMELAPPLLQLRARACKRASAGPACLCTLHEVPPAADALDFGGRGGRLDSDLGPPSLTPNPTPFPSPPHSSLPTTLPHPLSSSLARRRPRPPAVPAPGAARPGGSARADPRQCTPAGPAGREYKNTTSLPTELKQE